MASIAALEKEIEKIKKRNERVEKDKKWETSLTRRVSIAVLTYLVVVIYFYIIKVQNPIVAAIVPAMAYLISTLTFSFLKGRWASSRNS